jgi:hypothetical protein
MNLKLGSALKALGLLLGLFLGADVISETMWDQISGAIIVLATAGWDLYETIRLGKQGVVSTSPAENIADPRTPEKLIAKEVAIEEAKNL